jgi:hypothetical protein
MPAAVDAVVAPGALVGVCVGMMLDDAAVGGAEAVVAVEVVADEVPPQAVSATIARLTVERHTRASGRMDRGRINTSLLSRT